MPKLRERYTAVVAQIRPQAAGRPLIIGGRSMGGRVATMLAAAVADWLPTLQPAA